MPRTQDNSQERSRTCRLQHIRGGRTINHKQFEANIALIGDTIKSDLSVSLFRILFDKVGSQDFGK